MKYATIRFKPTGNEFVLPEEEVIRIMREDIGNYEVIGKESKHITKALKDVREEAPQEESVFNQVVEEEKQPEEAPAEIVEETPVEEAEEEKTEEASVFEQVVEEEVG